MMDVMNYDDTLVVQPRQIESMHDCRIVRIIEFLAVHRWFGLFIDNTPHRCFELEKIYLSSDNCDGL